MMQEGGRDFRFLFIQWGLASPGIIGADKFAIVINLIDQILQIERDVLFAGPERVYTPLQ
jgi:hypothetical protein